MNNIMPAVKRVNRDPAFKTTMLYVTLLANASKIASIIYQRWPPEQKSRKKYQQLTGRIMHMLKDRMNSNEVIELISQCHPGKIEVSSQQAF